MDRLSEKTKSQIKQMRGNGSKSKYYTKDNAFIRPSYITYCRATEIRTEGIVDTECILNLPYFNRYADKTQVYSLQYNDDITRRLLHVQLVSRIARDIGGALGLNTDLIEAIALGHDLGHTPFGHLGESILDSIYYEFTERHFMHNVQSVRVMKDIFPLGISLQTLDGALCHNGEFELMSLRPFSSDRHTIKTFNDLDSAMESAYKNGSEYVKTLIPSTLEGSVVRIADIIAYVGKDRVDARKLKNLNANDFENDPTNAQLIRGLTEDIVENSFGKDCIMMSEDAFKLMKELKKQNYVVIYSNADTSGQLGDEKEGRLKERFKKLYKKLYMDLKNGDTSSEIYKHHIEYLTNIQRRENRDNYLKNYLKNLDRNTINQIIVDFIASMTDSYFMEITSRYGYGKDLEYTGYFGDKIKM